MKHLLLILLFVPFTSIGQDMTFEDLMGFENKIQVERFLIEHNYERFDYDNEENIKYGYDLDNWDGEYVMNKGASIGIKNDSHSLNVDFMFVVEEDYNRIYDVAKKELEFVNVLENTAIYYGENTMVGFRVQESNYYITLITIKEE